MLITRMNSGLLILLCMSVASCLESNEDSQVVSIETLKTHILDGNMRIDVYLPPNYDPNNTYKTIYFNDGGSVFIGAGSLGIYGLLNDRIENQTFDPVIAVAVYPIDRTSWYTPYKDGWIIHNWGPYTANVDWYNNQFRNVIIPFMEETYATSRLSKDRAIFGFSLGGLHAAYSLVTDTLFSFGAGLSPSLWVADYAIFEEPLINSEHRLWIDIGTREWNYYVPFSFGLAESGMEYGVNNFYYEVPDASHSSTFWAQRVVYPLTLFLGNQDLTPISWQIVKEKIPSQSTPGRIFRRINPIVTLENGVKYSLTFDAMYETVDGHGTVRPDGSYEVEAGKTMKVRVSYLNWEEEIVVD